MTALLGDKQPVFNVPLSPSLFSQTPQSITQIFSVAGPFFFFWLRVLAIVKVCELKPRCGVTKKHSVLREASIVYFRSILYISAEDGHL